MNNAFFNNANISSFQKINEIFSSINETFHKETN